MGHLTGATEDICLCPTSYQINLRDVFFLDFLEVITTTFYMGMFGGATPKLHRIWSNTERLANAVAQRAGYMSREQQNQCMGKTVRKYTDSKGVKRCVGLKKELKQSQRPDPFIFRCFSVLACLFFVAP